LPPDVQGSAGGAVGVIGQPAVRIQEGGQPVGNLAQLTRPQPLGLVYQRAFGPSGGVGVQAVRQVPDGAGDDPGVALRNRPRGLGGGRRRIHRVQGFAGNGGAGAQHGGGPHPGLRLGGVHVQQVGQQPGRPTGQELHRGRAALQLGDQPVIHRRQPPPLPLQLLEHAEEVFIAKAIEGVLLEHIHGARQVA